MSIVPSVLRLAALLETEETASAGNPPDGRLLFCSPAVCFASLSKLDQHPEMQRPNFERYGFDRIIEEKGPIGSWADRPGRP